MRTCCERFRNVLFNNMSEDVKRVAVVAIDLGMSDHASTRVLEMSRARDG